MTNETRLLLIRIALTITCLEFFGPAIRDTDASHLLRSEWVGHARVHLAWLLGFMVLSGLANLYLVWFGRPILERLRLSALWQCCNLGGFWIAYLTTPLYDGLISVPGVHTHILGFDENVFGFALLSIVMAFACTLLILSRDADAPA